MRVFSMARSRRASKSLPFMLASFTALALFSAIISPRFSVRAQDAANTPSVPNSYRTPYDFTGDGRSDFANISISANQGAPIGWRILRNPADPAPGAAFIRIFDYGVVGDSITAGDYIGDNKCDLSVWRSGQFIHAPFPESGGAVGPLTFDNWGLTAAENPGRVGDYDGDGKDDEVIVRVTSNVLNWYIKKSSGGTQVTAFGRVVAGFNTLLAFQGADFNGDGKDDLVMANASTTTGANTWWVGDATTGQVILSGTFGNYITDYFLSPDDYTGDGKADLVVYRGGGSDADAGGWYIRDTATGNVSLTIFGIPDPNFQTEDIPVRGNFDGDNRADICVFRRATDTYYWIPSGGGGIQAQQWGNTADVNELPLGAFFNF